MCVSPRVHYAYLPKIEGDETLTLTEEKVSHPSTLEPARLTSKCLPFPVLEKSRKSYTLPKKGTSKTPL